MTQLSQRDIDGNDIGYMIKKSIKQLYTELFHVADNNFMT